MPTKTRGLAQELWISKKNPFTIGSTMNGEIPSRKPTYPTTGKGKSSSKVPW